MVRWLVLMLVLAGVIMPCVAQVPSNTLRPTEMTPPLNPRIAFGLSMLLPGAGQLYNGEYLKGVLHLGLFAGSIAMVSSSGITDTHESITTYGWFSAAMVGVTYIWAALDAYMSAGHINEENRIQITIGFGSAPKAEGVQATLILKL
jgi:peptidoglycan/LPS O-acetylase OafA/YrhL